ncbi:FkbM family methyltransferase [Aliiroseovarius crassostreae]|uniref:FkbM family methyltransferase n=1 Tax=Aliiroseovarius crassostreae TaxID=154981 RepID=UPI0021B002B4|nr:FkbM family methyltransferase [Aliiroseovarius crassostreae]
MSSKKMTEHNPQIPDPKPVIQYPDDGPRYVKSRGMRFPNDPRYLTPARRRALRSNAYEEREADAVKATVNRDDVVLELGAGMGFMSTFMARKMKVKEVHAYEANPHMIPYIEEVYRENGVETAHIHNAILGKRKGATKFYVRSNFLASSLEENPKGEKAEVTDVVDVEVRNFNTVLKELKPTVLVCDIEGAEADLLPGADLSGLRAAVIELHPQWIGQTGVQAVFDTMHKAGLTYFPRQSNAKVVTFKKGW